MQTQRTPRLQLALALTIAFALVFTGLCMYRYLVGVYEDHWVSIPIFLCLGEVFIVIDIVIIGFLHFTMGTMEATPRPTLSTG